MEHRWGERRPIDFKVRFVLMPATVGTGRIINISATGAFMRTQMTLRLLSLLYLQPLEFPEGENKRIGATVVRRDAMGVGLEWCEYDAKTMKSYLPLAAHLEHLANDRHLQISAISGGLPVNIVQSAQSVFRR
jgi:PilZ domain